MLTGGVIEAQVIAALRAHSEVMGQPETRIIFLEPARVAFSRRARLTLKAFQKMWPEGNMSLIPYVSRLGENSAGKALTLRLAKERYSKSDLVFHCRGPEATLSAHYALRALGRGRVIYDIRGAGPYEAIHRLGFSWNENLSPKAERAYKLSLERECRAASIASHVIVVSKGLKHYALSILKAPEHKVTVVPSCVSDLTFNEQTRENVRKEWGVGKGPVFIYSGRIGKDRAPEHLFRVFSSINRISPESRLVILTYLNQLEDINVLLGRFNIPPSTVMVASQTRDEVMRLLCGADVGFLFLESALRYKHCFPIKIPEYLAAGLPLIVNSEMEQIPNLVLEKHIGWVVDFDAGKDRLDDAARRILSDLKADREAFRQSALSVCSEFFIWRNHVSAIRQAYGLEGSCMALDPAGVN